MNVITGEDVDQGLDATLSLSTQFSLKIVVSGILPTVIYALF